jgi:hypothetical protein
MTIVKRITALQAKAKQSKPVRKGLATLVALCKGLEQNATIDPVTYIKPSMETLAADLLARGKSGSLTDMDQSLLAELAELPECEFSVEWLLFGLANPQAIYKACRERRLQSC